MTVRLEGTNHSRRVPRVLAGVCFACLVLWLYAGSASAKDLDTYSFSIYGSGASQISHATDVAVDNSSGPSAHDVYVAEPEMGQVQKFSSDGQFILAFAAGEGPARVAVDGSTGPSAGDVYVGEGERILKFDAGGNPITTWGADGELQLPGYVAALAVSSTGQLVALVGGYESTLHVFAQDGTVVTSAQTSLDSRYGGLAVDGVGHIFVTTAGPYSGEEGVLEKLTSAGVEMGGLEAPPSPDSLAIDLTGGALYVGTGSGQVFRVSSGCQPKATCDLQQAASPGYLGSEEFERPGIAVDAGNGRLYVTDRLGTWRDGTRRSEVDVFGPRQSLPLPTTGKAQPTLDGVANVFGTVSSNGTGQIESCEFEYVAAKSYVAHGFSEPSHASCDPDSFPPLGVETAIAGRLQGLTAGVTYLYRLRIATAGGTAAGSAASFAIGEKPIVKTGGVEAVADKSATLKGTVGDSLDEEIGSCYFEVVDEKVEPSGFKGAKQVGCSPPAPYTGRFLLPIESRVTGLLPEHTYRYRLVAANASWRTSGENASFATRPREPEPEVDLEPEPEEEEPHRGHVRCSAHACTVTLRASGHRRTWFSPHFPPSYGWLFSLLVNGEKLNHSGLKGGCTATFGGEGVKATLDACPNRFRLTYHGTGSFKVHWRVFEQCRCAGGNPYRRRP